MKSKKLSKTTFNSVGGVVPTTPTGIEIKQGMLVYQFTFAAAITSRPQM